MTTAIFLTRSQSPEVKDLQDSPGIRMQQRSGCILTGKLAGRKDVRGLKIMDMILPTTSDRDLAHYGTRFFTARREFRIRDA